MLTESFGLNDNHLAYALVPHKDKWVCRVNESDIELYELMISI